MVGKRRNTEDPSGFEALREALLDDRTRTTARIKAFSKDFTSIVEASQLANTDDEHDPEGATIAFERSQVTALRASAEAHLVEIDLALQKLDDGTYGICDGCGQTIAPGRLDARPAARYCITCASKKRS